MVLESHCWWTVKNLAHLKSLELSHAQSADVAYPAPEHRYNTVDRPFAHCNPFAPEALDNNCCYFSLDVWVTKYNRNPASDSRGYAMTMTPTPIKDVSIIYANIMNIRNWPCPSPTMKTKSWSLIFSFLFSSQKINRKRMILIHHWIWLSSCV